MPFDDIVLRRQCIQQTITKLRKSDKPVNRFTVQSELTKAGYDISESTVYRDMTALNRENTWIRDLSESNYSAYQEEISNNLEWVIHQAATQYEKTNDHVWLNIILKAQDTKMKYANGENINISAALLGKKFNELKDELDEKNKRLESSSSLNIQEHNIIDVVDMCRKQKEHHTESATNQTA